MSVVCSFPYVTFVAMLVVLLTYSELSSAQVLSNPKLSQPLSHGHVNFSPYHGPPDFRTAFESMGTFLTSMGSSLWPNMMNPGNIPPSAVLGRGVWPVTPVGGHGMTPIQPSQFNSAQKPKLDSPPMRNTAFWKKWLQTNHSLSDFDFNGRDMEKYKNAAGYETDEVCVYDLRMQYILGSPDGVLKRIIGFNGQFPGPTLTCTLGKTMIVRVTNDIQEGDEPTSIHWHGIAQNLSPFYDGPQSITQCPIVRQTSMIYKFQLFQSGTYWYHSHHSYQYVDGAWGFLIVKNTPEECWQNSYDEERLISINDWIHRPAIEISETYLTRGNFPDTNSSLINGRGTFDCSRVERGQKCDPSLQVPSVVSVTRGKRYRLRVLNSSGAITYNFSIDGHQLAVIETDGVDTFKSPKVDVISILPAQRYSFLVTTNQPLSEYWIRISGEFPISTPALLGRAILRYEPTSPGQFLPKPIPEDNAREPGTGVLQGRAHFHDIPWDDIISSGGINIPTHAELDRFFTKNPPMINPNLQGQMDAAHAQSVKWTRLPTTSPVNPSTAILLDQNQCPPLQSGVEGSAPPRYDRLIVLNATDCPTPGSPVRMCMNGQPFVPRGVSSRPILFEVIRGIPVPSSARPIYTPGHKEVIRLVINNFHAFSHPWHLHGHSFWVLGAGEAQAGPYVDSRDAGKLRRNGVRRDTTYSLGNSWTVISYMTDNPGVWFFHCHINWHLEAGLGMTFIEGLHTAQRVYKFPPPQSTVACARVGVTIS